MRRHPFYFEQHADGKVSSVLFHPDEHEHVVGSKRFLASSHHLVVGSQEGSRARNWKVNETDATGPAATEYMVRGGRGRIRPHRVVYKRQWFEQSAAVPHGFTYEINTTAVMDGSGMPALIKQRLLFQPTADLLAAQTFGVDPSAKDANSPRVNPNAKPAKELEAFAVLPKEPSRVTWRLVSSAALPPTRRRLSQNALVQEGFLAGTLHHPPKPPLSAQQMRASPEWTAASEKESKMEAEVKCDDAALETELQCLNGPQSNSHVPCLKALKQRERHCPQLSALIGEKLRAPWCSGARARLCGSLVSAHAAVSSGSSGSKHFQSTLASFLQGTTAPYVPMDALMALALNTNEPTEELLGALAQLVTPPAKEHVPPLMLMR
eukprot:scaffold14796_cov93-Phaeocystis_antarctica.AAC.1